MSANQTVTGRMEQHWEAPWIAEGDQVRFARVKIDVQNPVVSDVFARLFRPIQSLTLLRVEDCEAYQLPALHESSTSPATHMKSRPSMPFYIFQPQNQPSGSRQSMTAVRLCTGRSCPGWAAGVVRFVRCLRGGMFSRPTVALKG